MTDSPPLGAIRAAVWPGAPETGETLLVSQVRFLRDALAAILAELPDLRLADTCATAEAALVAVRRRPPDLVILDSAFPDGLSLTRRLRALLPASGRIIALPLPETEEAVLAWAEAGVTGYVPNTAAMEEIPGLIRRILRGRQLCTVRVAGALLRRTAGPAPAPIDCPDTLTRREQDIWRLLCAGQTNKQIAKRLDIGVGTAKVHVHNVLSKLRLTSRAQITARISRSDNEPVMQ